MGMENPYEASEVSHEEGYDNVEHGGFEAHHYPQEAYEPPVRPRLAHFAGSNYWTPTPYESQEPESQYVENHGQYEPRPNDEGTMMMRENMNHDLNKTEDDTNNCEETISQITATALAEVQGVFRYSQANAQRGTNSQTNEPDEEKGELGEAGLSLLNNQDPANPPRPAGDGEGDDDQQALSEHGRNIANENVDNAQEENNLLFSEEQWAQKQQRTEAIIAALVKKMASEYTKELEKAKFKAIQYTREVEKAKFAREHPY